MANDPAFFYFLSVFDDNRIQMGIDTEYPETMVDDHHVAIDTKVSRVNNDAVIGGFHGGVCRGGQVNTHVRASSNRFALILIGSFVAEQGHGGRVFHPQEYTLPQLSVLRVLTDFPDDLIVICAHLPIDIGKYFERGFPLQLKIVTLKLRHLLLQKAIT